MKTYKWYVNRKYIERESEKAILINVSIFKFWVSKKIVRKQDFGLCINIALWEGQEFKDATTEQMITCADIIEHFKQDIQETKQDLVGMRKELYKQEYKNNVKNNYKTTDTFDIKREENDFELPSWEVNEEDLI